MEKQIHNSTLESSLDGHTNVASMNKNSDPTEWGGRVSSLFIENILKEIVSDIPTSKSDLNSIQELNTLKSAQSILTSLVRCFQVQFSKEGKPTFDKFQYTSFIRSMKVVWKKILDSRSADNGEQAFVKYNLDVILCNAFQDPILPNKGPNVPNHGLFSGWLKKYIHRRIVVKRDISFAYSLQKGTKKCWTAPGIVNLYNTLKQHREDLSKKITEPIPEDLQKEIRKNMIRINKRKDSLYGTKFLPSGSACLQAKRADGGVLSLCKSATDKITGLKNLYHTVEQWRRDNYSLFLSKLISGTRTQQFLQSRNREEFDYKIDIENGLKGKVHPSETDRAHQCVVAIIPEAGKYRIVTKGDGYLAGLLQPLQGILIDNWKRTKYSTMKDDDLTVKVNELYKGIVEKGLISQFPLLQSGDYKRATDLLKAETTKICLESLEGLVADSYLRIAKYSVTGGYVHYPRTAKQAAREGFDPKDFPDLDSIVVETGQLMGHPLSFPLLCVINLSCYTKTVDDYNEKFPGRLTDSDVSFLKKNVIINGDDILFFTNPEFNELWERRTKQAGFEPSIGKNYRSLDTCMINSQVFFKNHEDIFVRKGYFSQKYFVDNSEDPFEYLGGLSKMFKEYPKSQVSLPEAMAQWRALKKVSFVPNWFFPRHLGGLGIYTEKSLEEIFKSSTPQQRQVAAMFITDPKLALIQARNIQYDFDSKLPEWLENVRMTPSSPDLGGRKLFENNGRFDDMIRIDENLNEWVLRFTEYKRMSYDAEHQQISSKLDKGSPFRFFRKHLKKISLKPIEFDTFEKYQHVSFYSFALPDCPPHMEVKPTKAERERLDWFLPEYIGRFGLRRVNVVVPPEIMLGPELTEQFRKFRTSDLVERIPHEETSYRSLLKKKTEKWSSTFKVDDIKYISFGDLAFVAPTMGGQ